MFLKIFENQKYFSKNFEKFRKFPEMSLKNQIFLLWFFGKFSKIFKNFGKKMVLVLKHFQKIRKFCLKNMFGKNIIDIFCADHVSATQKSWKRRWDPFYMNRVFFREKKPVCETGGTSSFNPLERIAANAGAEHQHQLESTSAQFKTARLLFRVPKVPEIDST